MAKKEAKLTLPVFKSIITNWGRLLKIIWKDKKGIIIFKMIFLAFAAAIPFMQSGSQALLVNELVKTIGIDSFNTYLLWIAGLWIFTMIVPRFTDIIETYIFKVFWFYLEEKFEIILLKKYGGMDIASREDKNVNDLINKIQEKSTWSIRQFLDRQFWILQNVLEIIFASSVIIFYGWWIFVLLFLATLPEMLVEMKYGRNIWEISSGKAEIRRRYWDLKDHFSSLHRVTELKLFQNTEYFIKSIMELFKKFQDEEKINEIKYLKMTVSVLFLSQGAIIISGAYFILEVLNGGLQIGTFLFVVASIGNLRRSMSGFFTNLGRQYQDGLFVSDVFKLLDIEETVIKPKKGIILTKEETPEIIFENVTFYYPSTKRAVLKNFSLTIPAGEKIALVGVNGAGKTTFVKLLCRFYDPDKGRILIGGCDLKEIDLESWYYQIGALFQDYASYHFTVKEAIAIGRTSGMSKLEAVQAAAKASEADIFIEEWENKYKQMLGKHFTEGIEPSIGQWQKLALARTFYRDPRVLILDEPTSSIDAESEAKIFAKIEALPRNRTVILISHRFSTVRKANKIVVIKGGALKEYGTHEELLDLDGTYAKLFKLQAKGYR